MADAAVAGRAEVDLAGVGLGIAVNSVSVLAGTLLLTSSASGCMAVRAIGVKSLSVL
jgi:hypothetical protein